MQKCPKPAGVIGLQLFCHVGKESPANPLAAAFLRFVTRRGITVDFKLEQLGQTACYFAAGRTPGARSARGARCAR